MPAWPGRTPEFEPVRLPCPVPVPLIDFHWFAGLFELVCAQLIGGQREMLLEIKMSPLYMFLLLVVPVAIITVVDSFLP